MTFCAFDCLLQADSDTKSVSDNVSSVASGTSTTTNSRRSSRSSANQPVVSASQPVVSANQPVVSTSQPVVSAIVPELLPTSNASPLTFTPASSEISTSSEVPVLMTRKVMPLSTRRGMYNIQCMCYE